MIVRLINMESNLIIKSISKQFLLVFFTLVIAAACDSSRTNDAVVDGSSPNGQDPDISEGPQNESAASMQGETTNNGVDTSGAGNDQDEVELMEADYPKDPVEIAMTWNASMVTIPNGDGGVISGNIGLLNSSTLTREQKLPVALYLHGCSGFFSGDDFRMDWLARQGYATIAPDSFARSFYPDSCNVSTREAWLYKPTIEMRQNDAAYALEQIRSFSWVDQDNVYIYGFSEGGLTAVTLNSTNPLHRTKARVVEGWNCISIPWEEYTGISSPDTEPLLTLFANQDPWLLGEQITDSCANFISPTNGSQSVLIDYAPLNTQHTLLEALEIQEIVLNFLLQQQALR